MTEALKDLLNSAAAALGAGVLLLRFDAEQGELTVLGVSEGARPEGGIYTPTEGDIVVPVLHGERELARLVARNPSRPVDEQLLRGFAAAASFTLRHAQELTEADEALKESQMLRELGQYLGGMVQLEESLQSMLRALRQLLNADYASISTLNPDGTTKWRAMDGYRTEAYKEIVYRPGQGMAARVIAAGKPITLHDIGISPDLPASEFPLHVAEGGISSMGVPLLRAGKPIGSVILTNRTPRHWKESEIATASVVANAAALAIEEMRAKGSESSQRAFLGKVLDNFPGMLLVMEPPDWRILLINNTMMTLLPEPYRSGASIIGRTAREITATWTDQSEAFLAMMQKVVDTGEAISFEQYASESPERGTTYWNWSIVPVEGVGEDGKRVVMLIAHDVTETVMSREKEQRAAERARARAEELDTIINQMVDGVAIFDAQGRVLRINPAGQRLLGRNVATGAKPGDYPRLYGLYTLEGELLTEERLTPMRALRGETVVGEQFMVRRPNGHEIIISVSGSPLTDSEGKISGAVLVFHDITQEKMTERLKDEFLSVVSHELRTPLSAIMGYSDLMLRGLHGPLTERQTRALNAVRANADRLLHLINDLLDVSKLESGTIIIEQEPVNLADIAARTIAHTRVLAVNAGVSISNDISTSSLPDVLSEETKLQQVLENLLSNALKFTPEGGSITFSATLSEHPPDDPALASFDPLPPLDPGSQPQSVVVSVTDTGAGIDEEQLARIWDRFYQVDSSVKRRSGGTGLGLAIVRSLVELNGGQAWVTSKGANLGSSFSFSLPVAPDGKAPVEAQPRAVYTRGDGKQGIPTVLIVEDDADQREIICDMLEMEGYKVVVASDGDEALQLAHDVKPSAIALDVVLPRRDGWEVLNRLKREPATRDIPVLIISVVDQQEFGKSLGADEYMVKPLEAAALRTVVRRLLGQGSNG
jgi:signal transduction histidine kinase/CheY-like chemotaxis protein/GAF domain-containing protein